MPEEQVIVSYFKKLFADPSQSNMGKLEKAEIQIKGNLCPRMGKKDQLFLYGRMKDGRLTGLKYMCALCDPQMFVAADILCRTSLGKNRNEIEKLGIDEYEMMLGGSSADGYAHFERARELLVLGMMEVEKS